MSSVSLLKEAFALAGPSPEARKKVIESHTLPSTEEQYYYQGLYLLQRLEEELRVSNQGAQPRDPTAAESTLLNELSKLFEQYDQIQCDRGPTSRWHELRSRFHLLAFPIASSTTVRYLKEELGLSNFQDKGEKAEGFSMDESLETAAPQYPSHIDPDKFDPERVVRETVKICEDNGYSSRLSILPVAVPIATTMINSNETLPYVKRALLSYLLEHPFYVKNEGDIVQLLASAWKTSGSTKPPVDEYLLQNLTIEQLVELCKCLPATLVDVQKFITLFTTKLQEQNTFSAEVWDDGDGNIAASISRQWDYAQSLPNSFNELKSSILRRQLKLDIVQESYCTSRLLHFLECARHTYSERTLSEDDVQLCLDYLEGLMCSNVISKLEEIEHFRGDDTFKRAHAKIMLTRKQPEQTSTWIDILGTKDYKELAKSSELCFSLPTTHKNPRRHPDDLIVTTLRIKNIPYLTVRIFQIDMFNYWRQYINTHVSLDVGDKFDLDGLCPTLEQGFDYSHISSLHLHMESFTFGNGHIASSFFNGRGLWVIDYIGGGKQCRSIVQKGWLVHMVQTTTAGHLVRILDENNQSMYDKCKIWLGKSFYTADKNGNILIPYREFGKGDKSVVLLLVHDDGYTQPMKLYHKQESYNLDASVYVCPETLIPNKQTNLFVTPKLDLFGQPVPLHLLKKVSVTVTTSNTRDIKTIFKSENISVTKESPIKVPFSVPNTLKKIEVTLKGQIEGSVKHDMCFSHEINFNTDKHPIVTLHLKATASDGYVLHVLGKNGEACHGHVVKLSFQHSYVEAPICITMQSDNEGMIHLGRLDNIINITATDSALQKNWKLSLDVEKGAVQSPSVVYARIGASFSIPCELKNKVAVYMVNNNRERITDYSNCISRSSQLATISGLPKGQYNVIVYAHQEYHIQCYVVDGELLSSTDEGARSHWSSWIVGKDICVDGGLVPTSRPLNIERVDLAEEEITLTLSNWSPSKTVALVTSTLFVPSAEQTFESRYMNGCGFPTPQEHPITRDTASIFLSGKKLSEEYQYILDRERAEKWTGSTLAKPSLLVFPTKHRETMASARHLNDGNEFNKQVRPAQKHINQNFAKCAMYSSPYHQSDFFGDEVMAFLDETCPVLDIRPDEVGRITIPRNQLGRGNILQILVRSGFQVVTKSFVLPDLSNVQPRTNDLRHSNDGLGREKLYIRSKSIALLQGGESSEVKLRREYEWAVVESFERLFELFKNIAPANVSAKLSDFEFLTTWPTFDEKRKLEIHEDKGCHELNFWLKYKDKSFFDQHIKPVIKSKIHKSFMDTYLCDEELTAYANDLWLFQQLNVAEKALLTTKIPDILPIVLGDFKQVMSSALPSTDNGFDVVLAGNVSISPETAEIQVRLSELRSLSDLPRPSVPANFCFARALPLPPDGSTRNDSGPPMRFGAAPRAAGLQNMQLEDFMADNSDGANDDEDDMNFVVDMEYVEALNVLEDGEDELREQEEGALRERAKTKQPMKPYQFVKPTTEWTEKGYIEAPYNICPTAFWIDLLESRKDTMPFLSGNFIYATQSITEVIMAMALIDLPYLSNAQYEQTADLGSKEYSIRSQSPAMIFYRGMKELEVPTSDAADKKQPTISLHQGFFVVTDETPQRQSDELKMVSPNDLYTMVEYGWQMVVSNMSSKACHCEITFQVPTGSIPTQKTVYCDSKKFKIPPYTILHDVVGSFYFPSEGIFTLLPVAVTSEDSLVAHVDALSLTVHATTADLPENATWATIASSAPASRVIQFLVEYPNLMELDLNFISWRMSNANFARQVFDTLGKKRKFYSPVLWELGVAHKFTDVIRELLLYDTRAYGPLNKTGKAFSSPLVDLKAFEVGKLNVYDYYPLIQARVHPLSSTPEILNKQFYDQYDNFLTYLCQKNTHGTSEYIMFAIYMTIQNRISEANELYVRARQAQQTNEAAEALIQLDYLGAYLQTRIRAEDADQAAELIDFSQVREMALRHVNAGPLRWKKMFTDLVDFIDQVENSSIKCSDMDPDLHRAVNMEPILDFNIQDDAIKIHYANVTDIEIRYYPIHVERLFSSDPFLGGGIGTRMDHCSQIKPSLVEQHTLPEQKDSADMGQDDNDDFDLIGVGKIRVQTHRIPIPDKIHKQHVVVQVSTLDKHSLSRRQTYLSHHMVVHVVESYGVVRVVSQQTKRPLAGTYVKVYAKLKSPTDKKGQVKFWKDGYTGLNGVFDYVSVTEGNSLLQNGQQLEFLVGDQVSKFSLLVVSTHDGTVVKEAYPPSTFAST